MQVGKPALLFFRTPIGGMGAINIEGVVGGLKVVGIGADIINVANEFG